MARPALSNKTNKGTVMSGTEVFVYRQASLHAGPSSQQIAFCPELTTDVLSIQERTGSLINEKLVCVPAEFKLKI
jgi:hypothetical protein